MSGLYILLKKYTMYVQEIISLPLASVYSPVESFGKSGENYLFVIFPSFTKILPDNLIL